MPPEGMNGQSQAVPNSAAELPAGGPGRAGMFNRFLDDVDEHGTSSVRKRGQVEPPPEGNYDLEKDDQEAKPKPRKAQAEKKARAKTPPAKEAEDEVLEDEAGDEDLQTDDDPDVDDKSSEADDDGEADDETQKPLKSFEEIAEALGLEAEDLAELEFEIRRNGKPVKVSYKELLKGYGRQQDLTRGFQEVAEAKRQTSVLHQEVADAFKARVSESAALLRAFHAHMTVTKERLASLKDKPNSYAAAVARNEEAERLFAKGLEEVEAIDAKRQEAEDKAKEARLVYEYDTFVTRNPQYRDPAKLEKLGEDMAKFLRPRGWSADEVNDISDHRIIELVLEAMKPAKRAEDKKAITAATVRKVASRTLKGKPAPEKASAREQRVRRAAAQVGKRDGAFADWLDASGY